MRFSAPQQLEVWLAVYATRQPVLRLAADADRFTLTGGPVAQRPTYLAEVGQTKAEEFSIIRKSKTRYLVFVPLEN